jgi:YD repeat-containing protein
MKNLLKTIILLLAMIFIGCSKDDIAPTSPIAVDPPAVVPPIITTAPVASLMKPAIKNSNSSTKNRTSGVTKHVVSAIIFANTTVTNIYTYNLNGIKKSEYLALPTDNLYDPAEEALNATSIHGFENTFVYNSSNQLVEIKNKSMLPTPIDMQSEFFSYDGTGTVNATKKDAYNQSYTYNAAGLIDKKLKSDGTLDFTYEYDTQGRIISVFHYMGSNNQADMHYTYSYPDSNFYWKVWYAVNSLDQSEDKVDSVLYQFDPSKAGVYNKEPIYRLNNEYLHIIELTDYPKYNAFKAAWSARPKYFYDADGYLIKYDKAGLNFSGDITVYKYE